MSQPAFLVCRTHKVSQVWQGGGGSAEVGTMSQLWDFLFVDGFPHYFILDVVGIQDEMLDSPECRIVGWLQATRKMRGAVPVSVKVAKPKIKPKSKTAKIHIYIPN